VARLKRTHQFHPYAVSAVLPLLARTRQWETAVELVELMPRHGHVPTPSPLPALPQSLFSSLLLFSLARVVAGGW
jgi:pentatricopeptide repeat protein